MKVKQHLKSLNTRQYLKKKEITCIKLKKITFTHVVGVCTNTINLSCLRNHVNKRNEQKYGRMIFFIWVEG